MTTLESKRAKPGNASVGVEVATDSLTMPTASRERRNYPHKMYESDLQKAVSRAIIEKEVSEIVAGISDNERVVMIQTDDEDLEAAYTADEAREMANALRCVSGQRWETDHSDMVEYIRDLADVVDNDLTTDEFRDKWDGRDIRTEL